MATDLFPTADTQSVDLTGLPEGVAQGIRQLVRALREGQPRGAGAAESSNGQHEELLVISRPRPSLEELDRLLDELSSSPAGKVLPPDFSRADIYDEHD